MINIFVGVVLIAIGYLLGVLICEKKTKFIRGTISNVRIYNFELNSSEIDRLSGGGK